MTGYVLHYCYLGLAIVGFARFLFRRVDTSLGSVGPANIHEPALQLARSPLRWPVPIDWPETEK